MPCPIHTRRRHPSGCRFCREAGPGELPLAETELVRQQMERNGRQLDMFKRKQVTWEPSRAPGRWMRGWLKAKGET